jgi:hypothetical protein
MSVSLTIAHGAQADFEAVELHRAPSGKVTKWGLRAHIFEAGNDLAVASGQLDGLVFTSRAHAEAAARESSAVENRAVEMLQRVTAEREAAAAAEAEAAEAAAKPTPEAIAAAAAAAAEQRAAAAADKPKRNRRKYPDGPPPFEHPANEVMSPEWLALRTAVRDAYLVDGDPEAACALLLKEKMAGASWVAVESIARSRDLRGLNNALWVAYRAATRKGGKS